MTPDAVGTFGLFVSAVIATAGFIGYATLARFWQSRGGWHVFWFMLVIAWLLDLGSISHLWDTTWFAWLRMCSFAIGLPFVLGWRAWLIFDLQLPCRSLRRRERTVTTDSYVAESHAAGGGARD